MSDIHANKNINFLPLRGTMVFPHTVMHIDVARPKSIASVYAAMEDDQRIFLVTQNNDEIDDPGLKDLFKAGTIARITQVLLHQPGSGLRVLIEGENRARLLDVENDEERWIATVAPLVSTARQED